MEVLGVDESRGYFGDIGNGKEEDEIEGGGGTGGREECGTDEADLVGGEVRQSCPSKPPFAQTITGNRVGGITAPELPHELLTLHIHEESSGLLKGLMGASRPWHSGQQDQTWRKVGEGVENILDGEHHRSITLG